MTSSNSYNQTPDSADTPVVSGVKKYKWWLLIAFPAWVLIGFFAAQALVVGVWQLLYQLGAPLGQISQSLANAILATILYIVALLFVIGLPLLTKKFV